MSWPSHVCCKRANLSLLSYAQILFSYSQSAVVYACRRVRVSSCCVELVVCVVVLCYLATWAFLGLGKSMQYLAIASWSQMTVFYCEIGIMFW